MHKRRQRAALCALLFGAFYFLTEGLAKLFNQGKPYLKFLKHVDLGLPIHWLLEFARTVGLHHPVYIRPVYVPALEHWDWMMRVRAVALGTLIYIALGYLLGFILPVSRIPHGSEEALW